MASDTGTLELERVQEARRRLESERDDRVLLGPDDQPSTDALDLDTDPATRAAQIVHEVLTAAGTQDVTDTGPVLPPAGEGPAAARARRIVEEVLAAATDATDAETVTADDAAELQPLEVRADLVLLGLPEPLVLLPGETFEPTPRAYRPRIEARRLGGLVDRAIESVRLEPEAHDRTASPHETDELTTPQTVKDAIRGAAESSNRHGVRWVVAGAIWALAFGLAGPMAYKTIVSSADMTIDLWAEEEAVAESPVDIPADELPEPADPADPAEAEFTE